MSDVKFCKSCAVTKINVTPSSDMKNVEFSKGYIIGWGDGITNCPFCNTVLTDPNISKEDFFTLRKASNFNRQLLDAMIELKERDIIEYELKMSQFRAQANMQQSTPQQSNVPKCPTCGSTNIRKISVGAKMGGAAMFGLFSKTAKSQFECGNCKYKW